MRVPTWPTGYARPRHCVPYGGRALWCNLRRQELRRLALHRRLEVRRRLFARPLQASQRSQVWGFHTRTDSNQPQIHLFVEAQRPFVRADLANATGTLTPARILRRRDLPTAGRVAPMKGRSDSCWHTANVTQTLTAYVSAPESATESRQGGLAESPSLLVR